LIGFQWLVPAIQLPVLGVCDISELSFELTTYHSVDFTDGQAEICGLEAGVHIGLEEPTVVHALVEVVAPNLGRVLRQSLATLQHCILGHRRLCRHGQNPRNSK